MGPDGARGRDMRARETIKVRETHTKESQGFRREEMGTRAQAQGETIVVPLLPWVLPRGPSLHSTSVVKWAGMEVVWLSSLQGSNLLLHQ